MGSADWMQRNLDKRVELVFPIQDKDLIERSFKIVETLKKDVLNTRIQKSDTTYELLDRRGKKVHNSQREFSEMAKKALSEKVSTVNEEQLFVPLTSENFKENYDENL